MRSSGGILVVVNRHLATEYGKLMVSLPLGAYAPKTTSAIALAPSVPGIHTSRTAFAFDTTSRRSSGRPLKRTTTTFSLTSETRSSSLCWISGMRMFALLVASPDCRRSSPIARTTTSASFAAFTASRSIASSSSGVWDCSIASPKPSRRMSEPSIGEPAWKLMFVVSAALLRPLPDLSHPLHLR